MKRFFASDAESDMLIAEATKTFGLKIGDIINMAIKNQFLPITEHRSARRQDLSCNAIQKERWKLRKSSSR